MTNNLPLILIIITSTLGVGLIALFFFALSLKKEIQYLRKFNSKMFSTLSVLMQDIKNMGDVTIDIGEQVNKISSQVHHLDARQDEIDLNEQTEKPIQQAIALIEKGADIDEIMKNCKLSQAEAELLFHLHR